MISLPPGGRHTIYPFRDSRGIRNMRLTLFSLQPQAQRKKLCKKEMPHKEFSRSAEREEPPRLHRANF